MGSVDRVEDLTFKLNFTGDGAARLRDKVKDKLKEYMGDYTDDTLVEYVIVLLRNGRRKEEAKNELNVFLGDDSDSFVSWLWEHMASNLDRYIPHQESCLEESAKTRSTVVSEARINDPPQMESDSDRGKSKKLPRSRHNREWKGLVMDAAEPPPLRSSEFDNIHFDEKTKQKVSHRRSMSPRSSQKKRSRPDEQQDKKRDAVPQANIDAPRRLLQFAVRDAVGSSRPSFLTKEPSFKRIRSVVSTSSGDSSLRDCPRRLQSVARVPNAMSTVIKAVAEAAEDVVKVKSGGSVFDRLGRGMDVSKSPDQQANFREPIAEDDQYGDISQTFERQSTYLQRSEYDGQQVRNVVALESQTGLASDSMSDNEGYDDFNVMDHSVMDVSQTGTSAGNKVEDSVMVQYNLAKDNEFMKLTRNKDRDQSVAAASKSSKIVNISVNVNTWKPPHYQESREVLDMNARQSIQKNDPTVGKSFDRLMKENGNLVTVGNAKPAGDIKTETQKTVQSGPGSYAAGRPLEDADSRTIFVSNVHFAATKDSLSRHFNKFGEVLKVVIVTDASTGQPKGSAFIEFMRKEAADNALSLDGTSFMSRILKVVKRSSAPQETASMMTWPRIARGTTYAAARFSRAAFPRGMPGVFRPRLPIKPGARSFQWKREAQSTATESGASVPGNSFPTPTGRSLTYVRTEPKSDGNSGTT